MESSKTNQHFMGEHHDRLYNQIQLQNLVITDISQKLDGLVKENQRIKTLLAHLVKSEESPGLNGNLFYDQSRSYLGVKHLQIIALILFIFTMLILIAYFLLTFNLNFANKIYSTSPQNILDKSTFLNLPAKVKFINRANVWYEKPSTKLLLHPASVAIQNLDAKENTFEYQTQLAGFSWSKTPTIIDKSGWGGRPAVKPTKPLNHPVSLVIIMHTASPMCNSFEECSARVRNIQDYHVSERRSSDINYNFLIGGDGNIYVGRGWDAINYTRDDSISISFIGNFVYEKLTAKMISAAKKLLDEGVKTKKLSASYALVCHNQTSNTLSPGMNAYEEVKTWPHYKSGKVV